MAYNVIRKKLGSANPVPANSGPTALQVNQVGTAVGAIVDFLSWQKNATEIWRDPGGVPRSTYVSFVTDTAKLLTAAKEAGLKVPGLSGIVTSLAESANKLVKIALDIEGGKGVQINDLISVASEGLAIASEIPGLKLTPVGVGMKLVGSGLSAVSLVVPDDFRVGVPGVVLPSRFVTSGADLYKDASGEFAAIVVTVRDTETGQLTKHKYDASGKLTMSVREMGGNTFEVTIPGNSVPSILNGINPLGSDQLLQRFGPPARGSQSNAAGTDGQFADLVALEIDGAIAAELQSEFAGIDSGLVNFAVLDSDNSLALSGADGDSSDPNHLAGSNVQIRGHIGGKDVVLLALLDVSLSDAGNGYFSPRIESINGHDLPDGGNALDPQDLQAYGFTFQNLTTGTLPSTVTSVIDGLDPAALTATGQPIPRAVSTTLPNNTTQTRIELGNGTTLTTVRNDDRRVISVSEEQSTGYNQSNVASYHVNGDGTRTLVNQGTRVYSNEGGYTDSLSTPDGQRGTYSYSEAGELVGSTSTTSGVNNISAANVLGTLNDVVNFGRILGSNVPGGIKLAHGAILLNQHISAETRAAFPVFGTAANIAQGALSLYSLSQAFGSGGSDIARVSAVANALNLANRTLITNNLGHSGLNTVLNGSGAAGSVPGVLPVINLLASYKAKDVVGVTQSLISLINPSLLLNPATGITPLGWALLAAQVLKAVFADEVPRAWGSGEVVFGEGLTNLASTTTASGENFGPDRVRGQLTNVVDALQGVIDAANAGKTDATLHVGLIPQRVPDLQWRASEFGDPGYAITDVNALTGEQRFGNVRFDDDGKIFNIDPDTITPELRNMLYVQGASNFRQMDAYMVNSALGRQVVAPIREVETAKMRENVRTTESRFAPEMIASHSINIWDRAKFDSIYTLSANDRVWEVAA